MLINILKDENPTHLAVAFDVSRATFRTEEYPEYKAGRNETPSEFKGQVAIIKQVLAALNIITIEREGFEADDIIATLTTMGLADNHEVLICSGDRDTFQLVTDHSTVLYPIRGVSELARMTPEAIFKKYGVSPVGYSDLAALVGEVSDNLPGVPGVGPKTAAKWIAKYNDLAGIIAAADQITGKVGENLREHLASVERNRRLNALLRDMELDVTIEKLQRTDPDQDATLSIFQELEFKVLRDKILGASSTTPKENPVAQRTPSKLIKHEEFVNWLSENVAPGSPVGVSIPDPQLPDHLGISGLAISSDTCAAYIELNFLDISEIAALADWLADESYPKIAYDTKALQSQLNLSNLAINGLCLDITLANYLISPEKKFTELSDIFEYYLGSTLATSQHVSTGQLSLVQDDPAVISEVTLIEAQACLSLFPVLTKELGERNGLILLDELELPLTKILARMESVGIQVNLGELQQLDAYFAQEVSATYDRAISALPEQDVHKAKLNLGSPKQLQVVLFDILGMPKTKKTKTGFTTDADALAELYAKTGHPFLEELLRHRDVSRLRQTVVGLQKATTSQQRIHTTFQQNVAATGRLSSIDPNLQNIPVKTAEGRKIRSAFTATPGYSALLTADYSQIELRIMAHLAHDKSLIAAFHEGEDLHNFVASQVFGAAPGSVTSAMRSKVKAMSYGLAYGLSSFGLAKQLKISPAEAKELMNTFFLRFGEVRTFLESVVVAARETGYTETIFGRRRYLPDLNSDNRIRREAAERMALNAPIQGSAADIIKRAMIIVDKELTSQKLKSRMLLQVHDELVFDMAHGEEQTLPTLVKHCMEHAADLSVPLEVSLGQGDNWAAAAH